MKFQIFPNKNQIKILDLWFLDCLTMYNITNSYIKEEYSKSNKLDSFFTLRKNLLDKAKIIINKNKINKHILDYSIKHCYEMWKSALSNLKNKNIKSFNIKDLSEDRNRFNLVLEPNNFSKKVNGFCIKLLGEIKSQRSLINLFNKNSILQYNKKTNKYYIISPYDYTMKYTIKRDNKCGIDLGVRTFSTVYSKNRTLEIGSNLIDKMDKYHDKMDKIKSDLDTQILDKNKYEKILYKYGNKMRNRINDLHKKVSVYLTTNFKEINIGKVSTSKMISNLTGNIKEKTKRRLNTLSMYKFMETLNIMSKKYDCQINLINEYKTSKTCHNCKNEHQNLGSNKIYDCIKCQIKIDRDINASINMYEGGIKV
jgi:putative transposase